MLLRERFSNVHASSDRRRTRELFPEKSGDARSSV